MQGIPLIGNPGSGAPCLAGDSLSGYNERRMFTAEAATERDELFPTPGRAGKSPAFTEDFCFKRR